MILSDTLFVEGADILASANRSAVLFGPTSCCGRPARGPPWSAQRPQ
jgi:hypothetical protein